MRSRSSAELGAYGVNFHDNDLVPIDATPAERDRIVGDFKQGARGLPAWSCRWRRPTSSPIPVFKDGAFTSHDPQVRAYALQKTMRAMDLGVELGAKTYVFWGGREGAEVDAAKDPVEAIKRFREAINFLCEYAQRPEVRPTLRARSQAERAARRHLLPHHGGVPGVHPDARRIRRWWASTRRSRTSTWPA